MTRTLWELLREHKIDLTTSQHICNDAMINGVSVPCETDRIEALEAALRKIAELADSDEGISPQEAIDLAHTALAPEREE